MNVNIHRILASIYPPFGELSSLPYVVFCVVAVVTLLFFAGYLWKGTEVGFQLYRCLRMVRREGVNPDRASVRQHFTNGAIKHLWLEYEDTLHEFQPGGNQSPVIRATLPAETYFTKDVLVDGRLFDDFTRHLPGILTGLGIIGTFFGLLEGLRSFNPADSTKAVSGLQPLLVAVSHAFLVSAVSIVCAIAVTFFSRLVSAGLYRLVEKLTHAVDALYNTGAGEAYLERLVRSSENSEAHAAQLKDAMVEDLSRMMANLVERQIEAQAHASLQLGEHIGNTINTSLAAPLQRMTDAMENTSRGNGEAVNGMLETVLTGFMSKLEDTFGGQLRGVNEQIERSLGAITSVQASMQALLSDIAATNDKASDQVTKKLEEALARASANQELMTNQMRDFVTDFRQLASEEQSKSKQAMDESLRRVMEQVNDTLQSLADSRAAAGREEQERNETLGKRTADVITGLSAHQEVMSAQLRDFAADLGKGTTEHQAAAGQAMTDAVAKVLQEVSASMADLKTSRDAAAQNDSARNDALTQRTEHVVNELSSQLSKLIDAVTGQIARAQANIDAIQMVSVRAIEGMNTGSATMNVAAQRFETAGTAVAGVFDRSATIAADLQRSSTSLQAVAATATQAIASYNQSRDSVQKHIQDLSKAVESARAEAGLTKDLTAELKSIMETLRETEQKSLDYLHGVNETLSKAFNDFGTAMGNQVQRAVAETDRQLGNGVNQLTGVVQELASALSSMRRAA